MSRNTRLAAAISAAAGLVVLTILVATGSLSSADRYAFRHLMPGGLPDDSPIPVIGKLLQYHGHHFDASQIVRLPGTIVASTLVLALGCAVLWQRGQRPSAVIWLIAFAVANAVVLLGKTTIDQPAIVDTGDRRYDFISSYPSGHATRIVLLAALFATIWPKVRWLLYAWALVAIVSLEIDGIHTPSDVAGGVLLGTSIALAVPLAAQWSGRSRSLGGAKRN